MKASILILTHNHQRWLSDAIDSALRQVTDFDFEVVIGVDKSDDRTLEMAKSYATHHENVTVLSSQDHLGGRRNFVRTLECCKGEYVAFMDGDDYWNDSRKLSEQILFLDSNADHSASITQARIEYHGRIDYRLEKQYCLENESYTPEEVIKSKSFGVTSSLVFRRELLMPMPHWFSDIAWGDRAIKGMLAAHGRFHNLQSISTTYRCNNWGTWNTLLDRGTNYILESKKIIDEYVKDYHQQNSTA